MSDASQLVTLGIGVPGDIAHFTLVGLSQAPVVVSVTTARSVVINSGDLARQQPGTSKVYAVDWDTLNLASGARILTSVFSVVALKPRTALLPTLDDFSLGLGVQAGARAAKVEISDVVLGAKYRITHTIRDSETPDQDKAATFELLIE